MTDPLEHFGEQQRSYELLAEHRALLARDAAEIVDQHQEAQPVGLILEADASEVSALRHALEKQTGKCAAGFVVVLPRKIVLEILRANAPHTLDFLEPVSSGPGRKLPLVAITRHGLRFAAVDF